MSNKILVTGADGFIGSHLVEQLVRKGRDVRAFTQYNSFDSWGWLDHCEDDVKGNFEVVSGDIRDANGVRAAVKGCHSVLHLAALIAIPHSYRNPDSYVDTNVKGTLNILQAATQLGVSRVIHTSTSEVYGSARYVPIDEHHPLQGQSPYSATKIAADQMAYSFYASFDLPVVIIRPFNTYGPRQSARAVIPTVITQILKGIEKVNLGAISPTRDFSYVLDTVRGFISALESDRGVGQIVNLGSNFEISIRDLVTLIAKIMKVNVEITVDKVRVRPDKSEVDRLWADNSKAKETFGWEPSYSGREGLVRGLSDTITWFADKNNMAGYRPETYTI